MRFFPHLDSSISRYLGSRARREIEFGVYAERRHIDERDGFGCKFIFVPGEDDFLNLRVRRLAPVWCERRHYEMGLSR